MKSFWKIICGVVLLAIVVLVIIGVTGHTSRAEQGFNDGIELIDPDTIYLSSSGVEVSFSDVILSAQNETRKLIVSEQQATVSTELTDRLIQQLDFDFLKKSQKVSYTGTGYFVVDLDNFTEENVITDEENKTVLIKIDHAYLRSIEIDPNDIIIDEVEEGLLAWGDIELTVQDYNAIEKEIRERLEEKFDTVSNGQEADAIALEMVKEVYEPIIKAIDSRYSVTVEFK